MKALANPILLRAAVVLFCGAFSFLLALICMRMLRKSIREEAEVFSEASPGFEAMPMHVYNTVIHQLKQQKDELLAQSHLEQQRARANELLGQAILVNLSSGVLVFGTNGLVKSNNASAKEILGFASLTGMGIDDIFRGATVYASEAAPLDPAIAEPSWLTDRVSAAMRDGSTQRRIKTEYETPSGENRDLAITLFPAPATDGSARGIVCLVDEIGESGRNTWDQRPAVRDEAYAARND